MEHEIVDYSSSDMYEAIDKAKKYDQLKIRDSILLRIISVFVVLGLTTILWVIVPSSTYNKNNISRLETENKVLVSSISEYKKYYFENEKEYLNFVVLYRTGIVVPPEFPSKYLKEMINTGKKYEVPMDIQIRLVWYESRFDTTAYNEGAKGLYQFMSEYRNLYLKKYHIAKDLGIPTDIYIFCKSAKEGFDKYKKFGYNDYFCWELFLSEYNSGKVNKTKKGSHEPLEITKKYSNFILYERNKTTLKKTN